MKTNVIRTSNYEPPKFWGRDGQGGGYRAATVCKRGHEQTNGEESFPGLALDYCPKCGGEVLGACPNADCRRRIRGLTRDLTIHRSRSAKYERHQWSFCDGCGEPYPWATRQDLIFKLEDLLDTEDITDHDRLMVSEDLRRLQELDDSDDAEKQGKLWAAVKRRAPGLLTGPALQIFTKVAGDVISTHLK